MRSLIFNDNVIRLTFVKTPKALNRIVRVINIRLKMDFFEDSLYCFIVSTRRSP